MSVLVSTEVTTLVVCTPCSLGIHSCCTSRSGACYCTTIGHLWAPPDTDG